MTKKLRQSSEPCSHGEKQRRSKRAEVSRCERQSRTAKLAEEFAGKTRVGAYDVSRW
jgi:hypothetical protein